MKATQPGLLERIASEEALWSAWDEVHSARGAPGVDGVTVKAFAREAEQRIPEIRESVLERRYRPRPLRRLWVPKRSKPAEFRALAIPAVRDRIVAGAAHDILDRLLDPTFHDSSFGFRPRRGTVAALRRILRLRDEGARWVARGDIDDFFGTIDQSLLFSGLASVLPWEVRRLLLLWTRTWVWDGEDRFRLRVGVPQGTPTSPLLANFYLTTYDEQLESDGIRMVRYVDDLAAPTRTEQDARSALNAMTAGLDPLGLRLNARSGQVSSFERGFEFLGFEIRSRSVRVAGAKMDEFRRHAVLVLEHAAGGSMRRRIARLNQMIRGWRAYYRAGIPRDQFRELDTWLEDKVREATLERWSRERPSPRELELAGLESLASSGRRVFQPPPPPTVEGYSYRVPLEGEREFEAVEAVEAGGAIVALGSRGCVVSPGGEKRSLRPGIRAIVIADGARCDSTVLRRLLEQGTAVRFVRNASPAPNPSPTVEPSPEIHPLAE